MRQQPNLTLQWENDWSPPGTTCWSVATNTLQPLPPGLELSILGELFIEKFDWGWKHLDIQGKGGFQSWVKKDKNFSPRQFYQKVLYKFGFLFGVWQDEEDLEKVIVVIKQDLSSVLYCVQARQMYTRHYWSIGQNTRIYIEWTMVNEETLSLIDSHWAAVV